MNKGIDLQLLPIKDKAFRFARKMLNSSDNAKDVVQDMFEKLWKIKEDLNKYNSIEAVAIKITKNLCLDRLKHEKQKNHKLKIVKANSTVRLDNNSEFENKNTIEIITDLIEKLPEKQKMIIHLRDVEDFELSEIAEIMDLDNAAIRVNLSRARKRIKKQLIETMNYGL